MNLLGDRILSVTVTFVEGITNNSLFFLINFFSNNSLYVSVIQHTSTA